MVAYELGPRFESSVPQFPGARLKANKISEIESASISHKAHKTFAYHQNRVQSHILNSQETHKKASHVNENSAALTSTVRDLVFRTSRLVYFNLSVQALCHFKFAMSFHDITLTHPPSAKERTSLKCQIDCYSQSFRNKVQIYSIYRYLELYMYI